MPGAVRRHRPAAAIVIAKRTHLHTVLVLDRDAAILVGQITRPRTKYLHARRDTELLSELPGVDARQDDFLPVPQERRPGIRLIERGKIHLDTAPQFPVRDVKRRGGDVG